jgi:hypothetical protein
VPEQQNGLVGLSGFDQRHRPVAGAGADAGDPGGRERAAAGRELGQRLGRGADGAEPGSVGEEHQTDRCGTGCGRLTRGRHGVATRGDRRVSCPADGCLGPFAQPRDQGHVVRWCLGEDPPRLGRPSRLGQRDDQAGCRLGAEQPFAPDLLGERLPQGDGGGGLVADLLMVDTGQQRPGRRLSFGVLGARTRPAARGAGHHRQLDGVAVDQPGEGDEHVRQSVPGRRHRCRGQLGEQPVDGGEDVVRPLGQRQRPEPGGERPDRHVR